MRVQHVVTLHSDGCDRNRDSFVPYIISRRSTMRNQLNGIAAQQQIFSATKLSERRGRRRMESRPDRSEREWHRMRSSIGSQGPSNVVTKSFRQRKFRGMYRIAIVAPQIERRNGSQGEFTRRQSWRHESIWYQQQGLMLNNITPGLQPSLMP